MSNPGKAPAERFEVSLGPELGKKTFRNFDDVQVWFDKERAFWQQISAAAGSSRVARDAWRPFSEFFDSLSGIFSDLASAHAREEQARQAASRLPGPQGENLIQQAQIDVSHFIARFQGAFAEHAERGQIFLSPSPRAKYCASLITRENPTVALFAAAFFLRVDVAFTAPDHLTGAFAGYCFEHGLSSKAPAETESLSEIRSEWNAQFQKLKDELETQTRAQADLNTNYGQQIIAQASEFKDITQMEQAEWQALHKAYDNSLALRKPVTFWRNKAKSHCILAWVFGPLSLLSAGLVFWLIYELIQITLRPPANIPNPAAWHPEYWRIAVLVASGVFSVWVIRIFVRLFLSHIHLHSDAKERVTMALTYLSLLRCDKTLQPKERDLILHALFRQAATGVVKDDGIPLAAVEYLTRTAK